MRAVGRTMNPSPVRRGDGGYSLVEMLVGIGVALVVGLGVYTVFTSTQRAALSQKIYNDLQTSCTFAMDQMKGELQLAGYRVLRHSNGSTYPVSMQDPATEDPDLPIAPVQGASTVTIEYFDDRASHDPPYATGYDPDTQVTYRLGGAPDNSLIRELRRHPAGGDYNNDHVTTQVLASNVAALSFTYLKGGDVTWDTGDPQDIRTVRVSLTCDASREDPNTKRRPQITLTSEVRARNIGVAASPEDFTPPATPTGLVSWDPGQCGTLELRWNANTEADLEGYTIFYGLASGAYSDRVSVTRAPKAAGQYEYATITGLDSSVTGVTPQPTYYFAIKAYDKSGNISPGLSAETSGNPGISPRTAEEIATYGTDTTVTPAVPAAPAAFTAVPADNAVTLTWTASPAAGLRGYRLYRSTESADFTPSDDPASGNRIAGETALDETATSYTDAGLLGCTPYHYKLAAIACDTKVPIGSLQFAAAGASPTDATPPPTPKLGARSGFRRIILSAENPLLATTPDFVYTKIWFKLGADYPELSADGTTTDGTLIPDHGGVITGDGTVSINFDSETVENPGPPSLQRDQTYSFLAVAYDRCGNHSDVTSAAQALGNQCGDGPIGPPSAPTGIDAEGCYDPVTVSWSGPDPIVHPDLFGYHVFRCDKSASLCGYPCVSPSTSLPVNGWEEQTGAYIWQEQYTDTVHKGLQPGRSYAYCIQATDCYYEENRWTWPQPGDDATNDPKDNFTETIITDPVAVGRVELETTMPDAVTGYLVPSTSLLPFTQSAADGLTPVRPSFQHNTVTYWLKNSAATTLTLQQLTPSWENAQAVIRKFAFGDGSTTPVTIGWDGSSGSGSPLTLTSSQLLSGDEKVPAVALYRNVDGSVSRETDSRQQTVEFTLNYRNDSTGTEGCTVTDSFYVPLGPYVYGTTQDQPAAGTRAWPIPGEQGTSSMNVVVANGGARVNVYTNVFDSSDAGVAAVKLYYYVDSSRTLTAAPALNLAALYPALPPYTAIDLVPVAGNQWRTPPAQGIPVSDGSNVWFFIVAVDSQANFDRDPEADSGAFQYYQQPADICGTTPLPPSLAGSVAGANVTLTWAPPASNTSGSAYTDGKGFKVYRDSGSGFTLLTTINDKNATTHTDAAVPNIGTLTYRYYVTAIDLCSPTPNQSEPSPIFTESVEDPCNSTPNPPVLSGSTDAAGGSVSLTWTAPATNTSGSALTDLGGYWIWRRTGTGAWTWLDDVGSTVTTFTDSGLADLGTVDYSYYVQAFDLCSPSAKVSAASNTYVDQSITTNPCDTQPGVPSGLTATEVSSAVGVKLVWTAPTSQASPAGMPYNDPGGYKIWRAEYDASGTYTGVSGVVATLPASPTSWQDTSVAATVGTMIYRYWVIAFDTCNVLSPSWYGPYLETYSDPCASIPGAPASLAVTAADDTGVTLSWAAPSPNPGDIDGYVIEHRNGVSGSWAPIVGSPLYGGATAVKDPVTDAAAAIYFYRVRAFDTCTPPNHGAWSALAQETYDPCATFPVPSLPTGFTAQANGRCRSANSPYAPVTTKADLAWTATTAPPPTPAGVSVSFSILACDAAGCTPGTAPTVVAGPSHGSGANENKWAATVDLGAFLALKPYTFGVQQVYTKGACVTRSPMATAAETCQ